MVADLKLAVRLSRDSRATTRRWSRWRQRPRGCVHWRLPLHPLCPDTGRKVGKPATAAGCLSLRRQ